MSPSARLTDATLRRTIYAFCREIGFKLDLQAPSHERAVRRAVAETLGPNEWDEALDD